jgi:hypothetical protein
MGSAMPIRFDANELEEQYALDKESIVQTWFFVGSKSKRMRRPFVSTKLFGRCVAKSELSCIKNQDRSVVLWRFENWREVLDWLEDKIGSPPTDPFEQLARLNVI